MRFAKHISTQVSQTTTPLGDKGSSAASTSVPLERCAYSMSITTARQHCTTGVAESCAALRGQAIDVLAVPLGGDKLAAEYLLLQLVSRYETYYALCCIILLVGHQPLTNPICCMHRFGFCCGAECLHCGAVAFRSSAVMQWCSLAVLTNTNSVAVQCRVHTRAASKPLGVLSLSLQKCPEAAVPSDIPGSFAPEHSGEGTEGNAATSPLSSFGAAVKEAVASLVPACVALPLTVNMVRWVSSSCLQSVRGITS